MYLGLDDLQVRHESRSFQGHPAIRPVNPIGRHVLVLPCFHIVVAAKQLQCQDASSLLQVASRFSLPVPDAGPARAFQPRTVALGTACRAPPRRGLLRLAPLAWPPRPNVPRVHPRDEGRPSRPQARQAVRIHGGHGADAAHQSGIAESRGSPERVPTGAPGE